MRLKQLSSSSSSKPTFSFSSFTFIKRLFSSSSLSANKGGVICISEVIDISPSGVGGRENFFSGGVVRAEFLQVLAPYHTTGGDQL